MDITFRTATENDLAAIVRMLADDELGASRERYEDPLPSSYIEAFAAIARDANNEVVVAEADGKIVAVLQLTFIPNLTYQGSWRALIEGVRVASEARGVGVGQALLRWAIARARGRGCRITELTTDKTRPRAKEFYERLGFVAIHEGMKLHLTD